MAGGFRALYREEGLFGLYRGTTLALVGVGNGALQFMAYEKMKGWAFERKRRRVDKLGRAWTMEDDKLVNTVLPALFLYAHPPRKQRKLTTETCFFFFFVMLVQYGVHGHVSRIEDCGVGRNIPVPSDPLTHSGGHHHLSLTYSQRG